MVVSYAFIGLPLVLAMRPRMQVDPGSRARSRSQNNGPAADWYPALMAIRVELRRDAGRIGPSTGPWIRRKQISRIIGHPDPHGMAQVVDRKGATIGWGLISAVSSITVRLLTTASEPPPDSWLTDRLAAAFGARRAYRFDAEGTTGYREVNSEGDGLPGLVVDRYDEDLVVQITTAPMAAREDAIMRWLREHWKGRVNLMLPESAAKYEGFDAKVDRDEDRPLLHFKEHGLRFDVPAPPAQKTGAYFDQRGNRRIVAHLAHRHGGALLDVGCHVGGFSLHAAHLGVPVVAFDQSQAALDQARHNARANDLGGITWVRGDMFKPLDDPDLVGPFGTVVLDPPKIASRKGDVDRAMGALARLTAGVAPLVAPGGHLVLCSCSHHVGANHLDRIVAELPINPAGRRWARVQFLGPGFDHPVAPGHLEGDYLRVGVYQARP